MVRTSYKALVEQKLDDMGLNEKGCCQELRVAAKQYYVRLIEEELTNSESVALCDSIDSLEGMVLGFVAGFEACARRGK